MYSTVEAKGCVQQYCCAKNARGRVVPGEIFVDLWLQTDYRTHRGSEELRMAGDERRSASLLLASHQFSKLDETALVVPDCWQRWGGR